MKTPLEDAHEQLMQALARYGQEINNVPIETRPTFFAFVTHPTDPKADADLLLVGKISAAAQGIATAAGLRGEVMRFVMKLFLIVNG